MVPKLSVSSGEGLFEQSGKKLRAETPYPRGQMPDSLADYPLPGLGMWVGSDTCLNISSEKQMLEKHLGKDVLLYQCLQTLHGHHRD